MTAYFDRLVKKLTSVKEQIAPGTRGALFDVLEEIDIQVVMDVSVCSEFPGFPDDLRERINASVLKWSTSGQPVNSPGLSYELAEEKAHGLLELVSELHTIFHGVAIRGIGGFGDDPLTPIRILYAKSEEKREAMIDASASS